MQQKLLLLLLISIVSASAFPKFATKDSVCGYLSCPNTDPEKLNVHIVPHSHDDVGWLKTVDQYYYGTKSHYQNAGVQYILDSVVEALLQNPERRFIYVETAFFWKWWQEKSEEVREQVRYLINNGQLEITGGAWSMNDEAAVHYQSTIDQFTLGFRKLSDILGKCARPKVGWQIDPFGHSRETASLFSQFGFDGLFFARLDWRDKSNRLSTKTAEMLWQGSENLGESAQLFTSVLYNHYSAPPGFCFDVLCHDEPIVDNKKSPEYNAESRAKLFFDFVQNQAKYYKTNNIIITMGDDFNYQDAISYFTNLDKLIKAVNEIYPNTTLLYSTPSCYLKAVNEANLKWPVKTDDFFPYASDPHAYWNGYFTSRPTSKRFERFGSNILQILKQVASFNVARGVTMDLEPLKEAIGIMQHHDAITGTEKQHVADDYARIQTEALNYTIGATGFHICLNLNISQCEYITNKDKVQFHVYNPLSKQISHYVRLPVTEGTYQVIHNGNVITSQVVPIFDMIQDIPGRKGNATHEVVFRAENIPPLGFKRYDLVRVSSNFKITKTKVSKQSKKYKLNFDNGVLSAINDFKVNQNFYYYIGAVGNNAEFKNRSSGAYIFRPEKNESFMVSNDVSVQEFKGPLVTEYHQKFNKWVGQVIRVYEEENYIEFNWRVGPIPIEDFQGKEIVSIFSTDIKSNGVFYTDTNGREMIKRQRGFRETFNLTHEETVAENYYPVTAKITIKDEDTNQQFSILNDRAQGGSSLFDGEVELMVHRRLLRDDAFGVGEALDEVAFGYGLIATGKHYLVFGQNTNDQKVVTIEKDLALRILLEPQIFICGNNCHDETEMTGLTKSLPENVHILTLEPWTNNSLLLRLEHIFEKKEDPKLSQPVTVDLKNLFTHFTITGIEEMSLGANQKLSEVNRMKWTKESNEIAKDKSNYVDVFDDTVTLEPMQIRTFIINIEQPKK